MVIAKYKYTLADYAPGHLNSGLMRHVMMRLLHYAIALFLSLWPFLIAGSSVVEEPAHIDTLRFAAQAHGLFVGTAVGARQLKADPDYASVLAREFNIVTPEDDMKFNSLHPKLNEFNFSAADLIVNFAFAHAMQVRGHTLVWYRSIPEWLTKEHSLAKGRCRHTKRTHSNSCRALSRADICMGRCKRGY